ncbi:MAG: hypothetical protein CBC65_001890 [Rhodothermaceae bacterium TMED105]|nr:MAG: hypothetical protein CBC65_001890 [Rhodothermaceae bacterium TMED105]|tara:strand:+ start:2725 stop:3717 length:993 start_codon:yes stop_codon:yes gene_type:complete
MKRKNCPLLSSNGRYSDIAHDPGLFVSGVAPYEDDDDLLLETLIVGPYAKDSLNVVMKRIPFSQVFQNHEFPENVAPRFTSWRDSVIPSVKALHDFYDALPPTPVGSSNFVCKTNVRKCLGILDKRMEILASLKRKCSQNPDVMKVCRRVLRNVFMFAMYARRWAGPGTPFPITARETNRNVGHQKPISSELVGASVKVSPLGEVTLVDYTEEYDSADDVSNGKAMSMMNAYLLATFNSIDAVASSATRAFLISSLLVAIPQRTMDGSHWPSEEKLWDTLFGGEASVSSGTTCIRQVSSLLVHTSSMLMPLFYKTQPQWMRYEGILDEIQ